MAIMLEIVSPESYRVSDESYVQLRPFFCAALAKRWKVQFRQWFAQFSNVDSITTSNNDIAILYMHTYI